MTLYDACNRVLKSKEVKFSDFEKVLNDIQNSSIFARPFDEEKDFKSFFSFKEVKEEELSDIILRNYKYKDGTEIIEFYKADPELIIHKKTGYGLVVSDNKLDAVAPIRTYCLNILEAFYFDLNSPKQYLTKEAVCF